MPQKIDSKAPFFGGRLCPAKQLTDMAWQLKRESLLPMDLVQARRAAKAEALSLAVVLALMALGLALPACVASHPTGDAKSETPAPVTVRK